MFVVDDGALLSGREFAFESISDAATAALPLVRQVIEKHGATRVAGQMGQAGQGGQMTANGMERVIGLAGWSYGGVLAAEVAKMLSSSCDANKTDGENVLSGTEKKDGNGFSLRIQGLVLFDAPLRTPTADASIPQQGELTPLDEGGEADEGAKVETEIGADAVAAKAEEAEEALGRDKAASGELGARTDAHFAACTALLRTHHGRPEEKQPLRCPVYDIRPEETTYACAPESVTELTTGVAHHLVVPGSHWSMLFGDNVAAVAQIVIGALTE